MFWQLLRAMPSRKLAVVGAGVLFVFSLAIYARAVHHGFVWDDETVFVRAVEHRSLGNIPAFFVKPIALGQDTLWADDGGATTVRYYRPLLATFHALEYQWFGTSPLGYKLVNLMLNGAVVVCAFLLVRALTGDALLAFLAGLLYAANPVRGEVVYWAYSDSHLFAALFALLTLLAYHRGRPWLALGLMTAGLLFQESVVLVAGGLLLYHCAHPAGRSREWWRLVPFLALAGLYLVVRRLVAGALPVADLDLFSRLRAAAYLLVKHLKISLVTDAPVTMYRYEPGMFSAGGVVTPAIWLLAGALLALGGVLWWRWRAGFFWYAWFVLWIVPTFNVGGYVDYLMAEKTVYLATLGPSVLIAVPVVRVWRWRWVAAVAFALLVGYQAWATVERGRYWQDTVTYIEKLLEFEPRFDVAQYQLGMKYLERKQYDRAVVRFEALRTLKSPLGEHRYSIWLLADAYGRWGRQLAEKGDFVGAQAALEKSEQIVPGQAATHMRYGILHALRGDDQKAMASWEAALRIDPRNLEARYNLERFRQRGRTETRAAEGSKGGR